MFILLTTGVVVSIFFSWAEYSVVIGLSIIGALFSIIGPPIIELVLGIGSTLFSAIGSLKIGLKILFVPFPLLLIIFLHPQY